MSVPFHVPAAPQPIQLPANMPGKAAEKWRKGMGPCHYMGDLEESLGSWL